MKFQSQLAIGTGMISIFACFLTSAQAFGPKPPSPTGPSYTLPDPVRHVIVRPFQNVQGFETPNQVTTTMQDAQTQLGGILDEVVTQAGFSVTQPGTSIDNDPCGKHLEIWPVVTDFVLDALSANIQFGFNSTGTINVAQPTAVAQDTITLGSVKFALFLYECDNQPGGSCQSLVSADANQSVLGNHFQIQVSYSELSASGNIFTQTDLGKAVQSILASGMKKLAGSSAMAQVPWTTTVAAVGSDGSITIAAGANSNLGKNQYFTVYAPSDSSGSCGVYEALDCVATTEVDGPSSVASIYRKLDAGASRAIEPGDIVEVGSPACAPN